MFRVGLRLLFAGMLAQALLLAGVYAVEPESEWNISDEETEVDDQDQGQDAEMPAEEAVDEPQFIQRAHQLEEVFTEDSDPDLSSPLPRRAEKTTVLESESFSSTSETGSSFKSDSIDGEFLPPGAEQIPLGLENPPMTFDDAPCDSCEPVFGIIKQNCCHEVENWSPIARFFGIGRERTSDVCSDVGIGHERVVFAPLKSTPRNQRIL